MTTKRALASMLVALLSLVSATPSHAWDSLGHMVVAYAAYPQLAPATRARANALIALNPKHAEWLNLVPPGTSAAQRDRIVFMIAATWPDEIKSDDAYTSDGSHSGNRPEGSPDPSANRGYDDKLRHKYWHFVDRPFSRDGTPLPAIPTPNAQERITVFRGVLASTAPDPLKSYDLVWLLHLVGDVHQPLHCTTRVSAGAPEGDDGGNGVKLACDGCPDNLHAFWDDLAGTAPTVSDAIRPAIAAAKKLPKPDPTLTAKSGASTWVAEGFQAAKQSAYRAPVGAGDGPFSLTPTYTSAAKKLAQARLALAAARLARLLNHELK